MDQQLKQEIRQARGKFAAMAGSYSLGVFNDNFFRMAAILLIGVGSEGNLMMLFALPYILLAPQAGWFADRFSKRRVVIAAKGLELAAMVVGAIGVWTLHWPLILLMTFMMALQSCVFGPALNGSIPELYPDVYVNKANAILKAAVTVCILAGVASAGLILDAGAGMEVLGIAGGRFLVGLCVLLVAAVGMAASFGTVHRPAAAPQEPFPKQGVVVTAGLTVVALAAVIAEEGWGLHLAGMRIGRLGIGVVILVLAALGVWVVATRPKDGSQRKDTGLVRWLRPEVFSRLAEIHKDKLLFSIVLADTFIWSMGSLLALIVASLAKKQFHYSEWIASTLTAAELVGVAVGGGLSSRLDITGKWYRLLAPMAVLMGAVLLAAALVPLLGPGVRLGVLYGLLGVAGMAGGLIMIPCESFVQIRPAPDRKGAVIAAANFAIFAGILISGFVADLLTPRFLPTTNLALSGGFCVLVGGVLWLSLRRFRNHD
jgi:MFS family permease